MRIFMTLILSLITSVFLMGFADKASAQSTTTIGGFFDVGFVGDRGSNTGRSNNILNFTSMGINISFFLFDTTGYDGTQGNDIAGYLRIIDHTGASHDISGAINWQIKEGNTTKYIGLVPDVNLSVTVPLPSGGTYTFDNTKSLAIRNPGETLYFPDGSNVNGSANPPELADIPTSDEPNDPNNPPSLVSADTVTVPDGMALPVKDYETNEWVTWNISGGVDANQFIIDPQTGVLTFATPPSYANPTDNNQDNTYVVLVSATDVDGDVSTQTLTVIVQQNNTSGPTANITSSKTVQAVSLPQSTTFQCASESPEVGAEYFLPGTCVAYVVTLTNEPDSTLLQSMTVTDSIPAELESISVYSSVGFDNVELTSGGMLVTATISNFFPGQSATFVLRGRIKE